MRFPYPLSRRSGFSVLACALWLLFWLPAAVWAGGFALQINDASGLDEPWPLIAGLPFPEGALRDAEQIRILDATGGQVPAQMDVAATWRDGSLRWVLAGFTASPQGAYRVEYGAHVYGSGAASTDAGLRVYEHADGVTVDTGAAVFEFLGDRLLPETARMGGIEFLSGSGDGAYLVDNQGRPARVAGAAADVTNTVVKHGPSRAVLRREGWYVTETGERVARTQAWFYFSAGTPYLRVTHSLIFTEDTNDLWVRDYGLEFRTPTSPSEALFALGDDSEFGASLLSMRPVAASGRKLVSVGSDEVFMLQDDFPHFLERESRAVVGRAAPLDLGGGGPVHRGKLDSYEMLQSAGAVGDWADGQFGNYGLTLVMPWLAQRFPKDLAFGPDGARAAFWSGRSGRELDFRTRTLIDEYWQSWVNYSQDSEGALAGLSSNAQGAARTHDLWLLPRLEPGDQYWPEPRAKAASHPPLVLADPVWLTSTEAIGWPLHPLDTENFPQEEAATLGLYDLLMERYETTRYAGFIAFGKPPRIGNNNANPWFRLFGETDYDLRRHAWSLYARSGDRRYYDYASRFNRFAGDWSLVNEAAPSKYKGEMSRPPSGDPPTHRPLYWGSRSTLDAVQGNTGHSIVNWLLEYYLTGDERSLESALLHGEALKARFSQMLQPQYLGGVFGVLRVLAKLYAHSWDESFSTMAKTLADWWIDLDNSPNGINDEQVGGAHYKEDRDLFSMYFYYRNTGDERAREGFLRGIDYQYRFNRVGMVFEMQHYPSFLFAVAYRLTGNPNYLRVLHDGLDRHRRWNGTTTGIQHQMNATMGIPTALGVLAETGPVTMYPLMRQYNENNSKILFRKPAGQAVEINAHVRMTEPDAVTTVSVLAPDNSPVSGLKMQSETMFETRNASRVDLRRRAVSLSIPAQNPAGIYTLEFPNTVYADVLDTTALTTVVYAPNGHRLYSDRIFYFWVPEGTTTLQLSLSAGTEVRRPDGTVVGSNLTGRVDIPVGGNTGVWSVVSRNNATVQLLNVEPIFSREPQYVIPWSDAPLDESDGSLAESDGSLDESGGSTVESGGSTVESGGSPEELDAPPNAPELEVSLLRTDMRPWSK